MKVELDDSFHMLEENYNDMIEANSWYMGHLRDFYQPLNKPKLWHFLSKFRKLLFNYLASFGSYIDHARRFVKHLNNQQFTEEYNQAKREKHIAEKTQFSKDLHNYSHHVRLLSPGVGIDYLWKAKEPGKSELAAILTQELSLRKQDLLKWKRLTPVSRTFLQEYHREEIIIIGVMEPGFVDQCQLSTRELHAWLSAKVLQLFNSEIANFARIRSQIETLERKLGENRTQNR